MPKKAEPVSDQQKKKIMEAARSSEIADPVASVTFSGQLPVALTPAAVIALQHTAGNRAVQRLVARPAAEAEEEEEKSIPSAEMDEEEMLQAPLVTRGGGGATEEEEQATPGAPLPAAEMEEDEEKTIPSAVTAPQARGFVDLGMVDVTPAWWSGSLPAARAAGEENPAPAAFVDAGNAGNDIVWWTEMNINGPPWGARGTEGTGTMSVVVPPTYKTSRDATAKVSKAWIQNGTGTFTASRGYHGVASGVQTGTTVYYLSALAAPRINQHEQGHTNQTKNIYNDTLQKAETKYHGEANALTVPGGDDELTALNQLKAYWNQVQTDFRTRDTNANMPISTTTDTTKATWDRQEIADATYAFDYGKQKLSSGKEYNHYVKRGDETTVD